jgi:Tfp pilus assembly protein PilO
MIVLSPQKKTMERVAKQLAEKKQIFESALAAGREETKIQLDEQINELRNALKDFAIDFEDSANLTFDISQIANEKKVDEFSIKAQDDKGKATETSSCEYVCEKHIDIKFNGGFNQFASFLNALERHRPVVFIDEFEISRSKRESSDPKVTMDLAVFVRKRQDG